MFALDYDGTIADTNAIKSKWISNHLGMDVAQYNCDRTWCVPIIGEENYNRMSEVVYSREYSLDAAPVKGSPEALKKLTEHGPIYVVTARDSSNAPFAEEWLTTNGLMRFIEKVVPGTGEPKIAVAQSLGCLVLVDDDIRHLAKVPCYDMHLLLLKPGFEGEADIHGGVVLCRSWEEAVSEVVRYLKK